MTTQNVNINNLVFRQIRHVISLAEDVLGKLRTRLGRKHLEMLLLVAYQCAPAHNQPFS
jgi:hypothetical protein